MPNPSVTIDNTTKVNLGILLTLMGSAVGGAAYLSSLQTSVDGMSKSIERNTIAVQRLAEQSQVDSKIVAVLQSTLITIERRITSLEKQ